MIPIDDILSAHSDHERVRRLHAVYREVLDTILREAGRMRELGGREERWAGALESWGRGIEQHASRHINAVLARKD